MDAIRNQFEIQFVGKAANLVLIGQDGLLDEFTLVAENQIIADDGRRCGAFALSTLARFAKIFFIRIVPREALVVIAEIVRVGLELVDGCAAEGAFLDPVAEIVDDLF